MYKTFVIAILTVIAGFSQPSKAQLLLEDASDPASMLSRITLDLETYSFENNARFYVFRPGYYYGLRNERHLLGVSLPLMHNVFQGDYAGFENTTGFGDLKMSYLFVPFHKQDVIGIERVTLSLDVTSPTGEYKLGRGVGTWLYKPGFIFKWRIAEAVLLYPEVRFQFSGKEANSGAGSDGVPDAEDPEKDDKVQNLSITLPATVNIEDWNGWFSLNVLYTRSFSERTDFLFLRTDLGKVIGKNSRASLHITKFIAGQPRLDLVVQANVTFFIQ